MTLSWVIDIRVNTALYGNPSEPNRVRPDKTKSTYLEDVFELVRFSMRLVQEPREMDIQECRNVSAVEQANMAQVNRFLEKHRGRYQTPVDVVPTSPHIAPFVDARQTKGRLILCPCNDGRE